MNDTTAQDHTSAGNEVATSLQQVRDNIARYEARYGREPGSVSLLAVSKLKPVAAIRAAMSAGQRAFGENYVDEALVKIQAIDDASLQWHFIGAIQSRKTSSIAAHFHWAHGVDRLNIARRLSDQRTDDQPPLNICLQVNTDGEASKAGASYAEIESLADACSDLPRLVLRGLMAIPAPQHTLIEQRKVFHGLRLCLESLQRRHPGMDTLSMGMSGDMEAAIAEGATIIRVGTAIFGERDAPGAG